MKKPKKHYFKYQDPELMAEKSEKETAALKTEKTTSWIEKDFKKTLITTAVFIVLIVVFYLLQTKTGLVGPLLHKFGL